MKSILSLFLYSRQTIVANPSRSRIASHHTLPGGGGSNVAHWMSGQFSPVNEHKTKRRVLIFKEKEGDDAVAVKSPNRERLARDEFAKPYEGRSLIRPPNKPAFHELYGPGSNQCRIEEVHKMAWLDAGYNVSHGKTSNLSAGAPPGAEPEAQTRIWQTAPPACGALRQKLRQQRTHGFT